jgi:ribA/ribD-fused uncharacterized protein
MSYPPKTVLSIPAHLFTPKAQAQAGLRELFRAYPNVVCGTGHRPQDIPDYRDDLFPVLVQMAEEALVAGRASATVTGGAIGWDQAMCQASLNLRLPTIISVPFPGQHARWRESDQQRSLAQLQQADLVYACEHPDTNNRSAVVQALLGRNVEMLRHAHSVLAFHSGKTSGGTAACLREAKKRGIRVLGNTFPTWEAFVRRERPVIQQLSRTPLSNFAPVTVRMSGVTYTSVEAAFQAAKTECPHERERIRQAATPAEARKLGQNVTLRDGWDELRLTVMHGLLGAKFRVPEYRDALLATGNALIVENNTWGDRFWGVCQGAGENHLGKLLMSLREELRGA